MKVYIIKQAKSPYKTEFFNELGKYIDLSIIYDYKKAYNRDDSWSSKKAKNHKEIFLRSFKFFGGYSISFGFNKYLNKDDSLIIVNDYSTLTGILSILYLKYKNIPFILNIDGGDDKKR